MIRGSLAFATAILLGLPAVAQAPADAARAQIELIGFAIDTNHDQVISPDELATYGDVVFETLDRDGDDRLVLDEIASFRLGMTEIAEFRGRQQAYDTAQAIMFDIFDRDSDGGIGPDEHRSGFDRAFDFADLDGDGTLTMDEYSRGFIYNIAMRAALAG
ncbi:EF hand [Palleronia salina]|uniref:EF hand n=1 Tax=Palleronia salina TaxID=313368 RepID=A0A1M6I6L4_9RHOB|nr:hypothetical protein [Palleronia salina]SHJ30063.1 EF hand [Palleronia salina]